MSYSRLSARTATAAVVGASILLVTAAPALASEDWGPDDGQRGVAIRVINRTGDPIQFYGHENAQFQGKHELVTHDWSWIADGTTEGPDVRGQITYKNGDKVDMFGYRPYTGFDTFGFGWNKSFNNYWQPDRDGQMQGMSVGDHHYRVTADEEWDSYTRFTVEVDG